MVRYFDEIVMVIGDESSFRRGVLLATNENDVLLTFKPQRILTVGNRVTERLRAEQRGFFCEEFRDAINRFVINPTVFSG
jgi:hypothetical protein